MENHARRNLPIDWLSNRGGCLPSCDRGSAAGCSPDTAPSAARHSSTASASSARSGRFEASLEGTDLPVVVVVGIAATGSRRRQYAAAASQGRWLPRRRYLISNDRTSALSVGIGGRCGRMRIGSGWIKVRFSAGSSTGSETDRYGVFAQISCRLPDLGRGGSDIPPVLVRDDGAALSRRRGGSGRFG